MNDLVQFVRNGLSCVKDLKIGPEWVHDPGVTAKFYEFPEPLNKTTPLEALVSPFQLYPFIFLTKAGLEMSFHSWKKVGRIQSLLDSHPTKNVSKKDEAAAQLVEAKLIKDGKRASRDIFVGSQLFFTGICFLWLFANSWHITETDWIGGIWGLMHALTVMEITLLVFLYYMLVDGGDKLAISKRLSKLAKTLEANGSSSTPVSSLEQFELMSSWDPFWNYKDGSEKQIEGEISNVRRKLDLYEGGKDDGEKDSKIRQETLRGIAERLQKDAVMTQYEGYRDYLFFLINLVAFYGYLMGILVFYFNEEEEKDWLRKLKFQLSHEHAEWHGNFAGDVMWTVEPLVVTFSPFFFHMLLPKPTKAKKD